MKEFLRGLRESGELVVTASPPPALDAEAERALHEHEAAFRAGLSPGAPELHVQAAHWAATKLFRACQLLTMRDAPPAAADEALLDGFEQARGPEVDYSVDLTFAYLPSLLHLAERVAPEDPVLGAIRELASAWPLSSVGISGIDCPETLSFWDNSSLRRLYIDRVIAARDLPRLDDPVVAAAVRSSLGAYPELEPKITEYLAAS